MKKKSKIDDIDNSYLEELLERIREILDENEINFKANGYEIIISDSSEDIIRALICDDRLDNDLNEIVLEIIAIDEYVYIRQQIKN